MPLSHALKRVLAFGAEEAERMNHSHIGTEHLLLGLLREPTIASRILESLRNRRSQGARQEIAKSGCPRGSGTAHSRGGRCRARNAAFPDRVASRRCFAARAWHAPAPADVSRTSAADSGPRSALSGSGCLNARGQAQASSEVAAEAAGSATRKGRSRKDTFPPAAGRTGSWFSRHAGFTKVTRSR